MFLLFFFSFFCCCENSVLVTVIDSYKVRYGQQKAKELFRSSQSLSISVTSTWHGASCLFRTCSLFCSSTLDMPCRSLTKNDSPDITRYNIESIPIDEDWLVLDDFPALYGLTLSTEAVTILPLIFRRSFLLSAPLPCKDLATRSPVSPSTVVRPIRLQYGGLSHWERLTSGQWLTAVLQLPLSSHYERCASHSSASSVQDSRIYQLVTQVIHQTLASLAQTILSCRCVHSANL